VRILINYIANLPSLQGQKAKTAQRISRFCFGAFFNFKEVVAFNATT